MANLFFLPYRPAYDNAGGLVVPGAQVYFTNVGGTPKPIYSNSGLTLQRSNPVVADGVGKLPTGIYLDPAITYRVRIYARGATVGVDTPIQDFNPYVPGVFADAAALQPVADAAAASATAASDSASAAAASASGAATSATAAAASASAAAVSATSANSAEAAIIAALAAGGSVTLPVLEASGLPANAKWFGAVGDGVTDDHAALQAWLDYGGELFLPAGEYYSSAKLILRKHAVISGEGYGFDVREVNGAVYTDGYDDMPGSRIRFAGGVGGTTGAFEVQPNTTLTTVAAVTAAGSGAFTQEGAFNSQISDLLLISTAGGGTHTGFYTRTKVHCRNVHSYFFTGKGFDISASVDADDGNSEYGSADLSTFTNCRAASNGGHAFHVRGREAGLIHFDNCDTINNGGWGYLNEAVNAACHYSNCHSATNAAGSYKSVWGGDTYVNCYVEGGTGEHCSLPGTPTGSSLVVGGNLAYVAQHNNDAGVNKANTFGVGGAFANYFRSIGEDLLGATLEDGNAAFHGHYNYGAVVQGKASAGNYDVSLFNRAGTFVAGVVTGQGIFRVAGQHQLLNGNIFFNDVGPAFGGFGGPGNAQQFASTVGGLELYGRGTTYDIRLNNQAGGTALRVPTNTTNVEVVGSLSVGGGTAITGVVVYAPTLTPASVGAATVAEQTFTVNGLTTADKVIVNPPAIANATGIVGARVSAANTLAIRFVNPTAGALTPSSGTYTVLAFRS